MLGNDAMEFLKTLHKLDEIWKQHDDAEYNDRQLTQFAERYHEHKLKLLGIAGVSTRFLLTNEQIETIADLFSRRECLVVEGQGTEWLLSHAFQLGMKAYRDLLNGC